jgi:hypothetical protein
MIRLSLARSSTGHKLAIGVSDATPVYLQSMLEIVYFPLVSPSTPDPSARMLLDPTRRAEAVRRLARLLGMLKETAYLDGPESGWGGAVTFGTKFVYYHELGHLAAARPECSPPQPTLLGAEDEFAEEMRADQFALAALGVEIKNHEPNTVAAAFTGVSLAMSFIASQEYVRSKSIEGDTPRYSIKGAVLRMGRLQHWTKLAVDGGMLPAEALSALDTYWRLFRDLLRDVNEEPLPTPVFSLVLQAADRPPQGVPAARFSRCSSLRRA